jgi:hypothetical protein
MSTFGAMRQRIESELVRTDLSDEIALAIKDAVEYYESERFYFNEGRRTIDTADGKEYYGLPTDFQEVDTVMYYPSTNIREEICPRPWHSLERMQTNTNITGRPSYYALFNKQMRLYPIPDGAYRVEMSGLFKFDELSASSDTNAFMTDGKALIRHRAKAEVLSSVVRGPEATQEAAIEAAKEEDELRRLRSETTSRRSTGRIKARGLF